MKVGVNLINFGPGVNPEYLRRWAQLSENLGYHLIMASDHIGITPDVQSRYPAPFYEPISLLGWLAGTTEYRHTGRKHEMLCAGQPERAHADRGRG